MQICGSIRRENLTVREFLPTGGDTTRQSYLYFELVLVALEEKEHDLLPNFQIHLKICLQSNS